jgi:small nuclear ribonucleoprotein (snRNP)-like protein
MQRKYGAGGGPMAFLLAAFERRACVCVVMRRTHAARGRVDGLLAAFDRHLNLVLQNATIRDEGAPPRNVRLLFIRGDNVVAVCR